jgi:hypothetical protein
MKIFINSYNRSDSISTHTLLDAQNIPYKIILHNEEQKALYLKNPTIKEENIIVSNLPFGMLGVRNFLLENLVEKGEWYMTLDDNIQYFEAVKEGFYKSENLPVKENPEKYKDIFENRVSVNRFMDIVDETITEAEKRKANLCGFASNVNFFFRNKKWREVGYVIGKTQLIKKTDLKYDLRNGTTMSADDYLWTAQNLEKFGRVLINNYAVAIKKHYTKGGAGTYEKRLPQKLKDCDFLMKRFPGLFRYKIKKNHHPRSELAIRFTSQEQVEKWRFWMRNR